MKRKEPFISEGEHSSLIESYDKIFKKYRYDNNSY